MPATPDSHPAAIHPTEPVPAPSAAAVPLTGDAERPGAAGAVGSGSPTRPQPPYHRRLVLVLGALSAFGPLSMDLYLPAMPQLAVDLGASDALAQLTMSACMVGLATGQLVVGPLSDRLGRRRPLVVGVGVYAVASLLCALAPTIELLVALRLVQGVAGGVGLVIARAIVRDEYSGRAAARMFSLLILVSGAAPVLAPLLGGQLLHVTGWRGTFLALTVVGAALTVAATTLPETLPVERRLTGGVRTVWRPFRLVLRDRLFLGYSLVLSLGACTLFTYIALSSFVLQEQYELSAQWFSVVFAVNAAGIVTAGNVNAALVGRLGPERMMGIGLTLSLLAASVLVAGNQLGWGLWGLLVPLFVVVANVGLVLPNSTALAMADQGEHAGTASAVLGVLQYVFGATVPPLASLGGAGATTMALTMAASAAAALALFSLVTVVRRRSTAAPG